ncbi:MAG: redoxin domain-containing protein [Acidobacteria bacterium]|jgi:peroxiredoxin|nr:redoxin domain-containing protein [Acidobacteriota bacterium]
MQITRRHLSLAAGMAAAVALTAGALIASTAEAAPATGLAAPDFSGVTSAGETISLSDFAGKTVVLEWTNDGCPFVQKHYTSPPSNMQTLQKSAAADDVVWISVISSAPGKQGFADGARADALTAERGAAPAHVVLDPDGTIGKLYGAKTTPHMFVISADGALAYDGAIDSKATAKVSDIATATNYVTAALADIEAGRPVATPVSKPYGCSVKYK